MAAPKTVLIGDRVRFESAAGVIRGEVVDIVDGMNAARNIIQWIVVEYIVNNRPYRIRLAEPALAMYKFVVTFRDIDIQIARGEKEFA